MMKSILKREGARTRRFFNAVILRLVRRIHSSVRAGSGMDPLHSQRMTAVVSVCACACAFLILAAPAQAQDRSAYNRIMENKTIRCGYLPYEPFVSVDPVSGEMGGIVHDYLNAVAAREGLTIDWVEEVNIDQIVPALDYGRIDAFCIPCSPEKNWREHLDFSGPLGGTPYYVYVPADSDMTDEQLRTATFLTVDGYALTEITSGFFPDADQFSMPQMTPVPEMFKTLENHKVDAFVNEHISASRYMENNPGAIRRFSDAPVITMRMFLVTPKGDENMAALFNETFDTGLPENEPLIRDLIAAYGMPKDAFLIGDDCKNPSVTENGTAICR